MTRHAIAAQPDWLAQVPTVAALDALGAPVTLVPARHPVVDIVTFQLLTVDLADARGIDPDPIRRDDRRWVRAREAYA